MQTGDPFPSFLHMSPNVQYALKAKTLFDSRKRVSDPWIKSLTHFSVKLYQNIAEAFVRKLFKIFALEDVLLSKEKTFHRLTLDSAFLTLITHTERY